MAAIVFPPHSAPRRSLLRPAVPGGVVRQVPVSHPRPDLSSLPRPSMPAPVSAPVSRRAHGPSVVARAGVAPSVYRRRRLGVAAAAVAVVVLGYLLVVALSTRVGAATTTVTRPAASTAAAGGAPAVGVTTYRVRSGDTLWSIARRLQPTGDVRPLVDQLAERNGGSALQVGQRLDLAGLDLAELGRDGLDGLGL